MGEGLVNHQQDGQAAQGVKARVISPAVDLIPALVHALLTVFLQNHIPLHSQFPFFISRKISLKVK